MSDTDTRDILTGVAIIGGGLWVLGAGIRALFGHEEDNIGKDHWHKDVPSRFQLESYDANLKNVHVAESEDECRKLVNTLLSNCAAYPVLGFDCEAILLSGSGRQTAVLLQLSDHTGFCAIIRLSKISKIPKELQVLLENVNILKVGVSPEVDAQKLSFDYGLTVKGFVDLRYASREAGFPTEAGLAAMAYKHLGVQMDKFTSKTRSKWDATDLSSRQKSYAAKDAQIAFDLFAYFHRMYAQRHMKESFLNIMQKYRGCAFNINKYFN